MSHALIHASFLRVSHSSHTHTHTPCRLLEAVEELTTGPLFPLTSSREWEKAQTADPRARSLDANYVLLLRALLQAVGEVRTDAKNGKMPGSCLCRSIHMHPHMYMYVHTNRPHI